MIKKLIATESQKGISVFYVHRILFYLINKSNQSPLGSFTIACIELNTLSLYMEST